MSFAFERFGRAHHLKIRSPADLRAVLELDEAHWIATTAPVQTINADPVFLAQIDRDRDGRIRADDVKWAVRWLLEHHARSEQIDHDNLHIRLDSIRREGPDGGKLAQGMDQVRVRLGGSAESVSLHQVREVKQLHERAGMNRAGLVLPSAARDPALRLFLDDVVAGVGGVPHPDGAVAVDTRKLDEFLNQARGFVNWIAQSDRPPDLESSPIMPWGDATTEAFRVVGSLEEKVDQFFLLAEAAQTYPAVREQIGQEKQRWQELSWGDRRSLESLLMNAPLAIPTQDSRLDLTQPVNPLFADALRRLRSLVLPLAFGSQSDTLDRAQWLQIKQLLHEHRQWAAVRPVGAVGSLPRKRLEEYVQNQKYADAAAQLIEQSHRSATDFENTCLLERLILFQASLLRFANSFVSFPDLYDPTKRALFEMGTLILDGRCFTLAVKVVDRALHSKFSEASNMFVLYAELMDREGSRLHEVAVPVTSGTRGAIQPNKWGIFHEVTGRELHARVVHIVENPVSFSEALWSPFRRLGKTVSARFEERATLAEKELHTAGTTIVGPAPPGAAPVEKKPVVVERRLWGGLLAGGGIAIAALGSSAAYISQILLNMNWTSRLSVFLGAVAAVLLPTLVVALMKLSKRDLSAILEGSGWGMNSRMRLTHRQARTFTYRPQYPPQATGLLRPRKWKWFSAAGACVLVAWLVYRAAIAWVERQ